MKIIIIFIDLLMATVLFFVGRFFIKSRNTESALTIPELQQKAKLTLVSATSIVEGGAHDVVQKETYSDLKK